MDQLLTAQSLTSLGYVGGMLTAAFLVANRYLPPAASAESKFIFVWLAFDAICHFTLEGSFLYLSIQGRSVNTSTGFFAQTWQEYAKADARWGTADATVVAIELLTVLGAGPMAAYICYQMVVDDPAYHYWIVALSTAEIYGGFMTFAPEWLTKSHALDTSNWLYTYVYLAFMNLVWVFIPLWLMYDSYLTVARTLRAAGKRPLAEQKKDKRTSAASTPRLLGLSAYLLVFTLFFFSIVPSANAAQVTPIVPAVAEASSTMIDRLKPIALALLLLSISLTVGMLQVADSSIRKTKKTNRTRRRKLLSTLDIDEKAEGERRTVLGIFHPYCNAGGGGERVLYEALAFHQRADPKMVAVIYTGDFSAASKEEMLEKAKQRFGIEVKPETVAMVSLKRRQMIEDGYWRRLTLLGQSYGSVVLALEAMGMLIPDVYVDTMGFAFTYPVVRLFAKSCPIGAYVHYPTISTDMLRRVSAREAGHTNVSKVAKSRALSTAKLVYYRAFAVLYAWALKRAQVIVTNGSWTQNHVNQLISPRKAQIVYPPCDTSALADFPLGGRERLVVSLAQFRPEKEHPTQLYVLRMLLDAHPAMQVRLALIGSARNEQDEKRIQMLKLLVKSLDLEQHVEFVVNAPWDTVTRYLRRASVGLSTMVDEHFGINVVEFMAAGLITLSHASAGPLLDIAKDGTGFHAKTKEQFAEQLAKILSMSDDEQLSIRQKARQRATTTFSASAFHTSWNERLWRPLEERAALSSLI